MSVLLRAARAAVYILVFWSAACLSQAKPADIPAAHFAGLDSYTSAQISPDGRKLAFLYPIEGRHHLVIHTFATEANTVIPPIETLDFNWMKWANNETLVFSMSLSAVRRGYILVATEETRLIALNVITRDITPLIKPAELVGGTGSRVAKSYYGEPQIQDDVIDWMPDDPDHILVALDEDFDGRDEVRKININTGSYRIHRKSLESIQYWFVDNSGDIRFGYGYNQGKRRMVFKNSDGEWLALAKVSWFEDGWTPVTFTDDPEVIFVMGTGEYGTEEVRTLNTRTGEFVETLFSNDTYDAQSIIRDPRNRRRIGVVYVEHVAHIDYFDETFAKLQATIDRALPDSINLIRSVSKDLRKIVVHSSYPHEPGVLLIWDRDAKSMDNFGWTNEDLDSELLSEVQAVEYESDDGTVIPAYLTVPRDADPLSLPLVVMPHGGPSGRDGKYYWFLSQFLVSRGYVVLQPNFRGSTGYGWEFENAGRGQWGGKMQEDVDAGARWLIDEGIADPDRICIVGWSYGGYSAAIGLVTAPELYQCGIGINGVYNLPQQIADDNEYVGGTSWTRHIGLDGESTRSVSPHHQADRFVAPFLIIHAEDDHRVRVGQADNFYKELIGNDKSARLVKVEFGGHSMVDVAAREKILIEMERFLQENIGAP